MPCIATSNEFIGAKFLIDSCKLSTNDSQPQPFRTLEVSPHNSHAFPCDKLRQSEGLDFNCFSIIVWLASRRAIHHCFVCLPCETSSRASNLAMFSLHEGAVTSGPSCTALNRGLGRPLLQHHKRLQRRKAGVERKRSNLQASQQDYSSQGGLDPKLEVQFLCLGVSCWHALQKSVVTGARCSSQLNMSDTMAVHVQLSRFTYTRGSDLGDFARRWQCRPTRDQ